MAFDATDEFQVVDLTMDEQWQCVLGEGRLFSRDGLTPDDGDGVIYGTRESQVFKAGQRVHFVRHAVGVPCKFERMELQAPA